ncbi:MAG: prepilin-type N-terminal cleavage/methylation domain-containing protein [Aquabacterium sp.]|uniref:PulJ/GspJ family protein n=1 Tax=Aquabacterium sp. TaxID=1872578 RepID=UPI001D66505B|nr:prepilin-type N-terminal cleavage/methylation domain-containing protein [Aquabacterium sp.]MBT9611385.1 prepilin-type N-terminal cleavage/methylation domain-containing protein [Aquabacterium sp.]
MARAPFTQRGFTLIEVLVALLILSVLAATASKGIDAISTARQVADGSLKQTLRVQSVMTQLDADLSQVIDTQIVMGMQFDGANLRLTRRTSAGVQVVVWTVRERRLLRWASPETSRVGDLQTHWRNSNQLQGREVGTLVALNGVDQWQVFCFRNGSLSNCQSTGNVVRTASGTGTGAGAAGTGGGTTGSTTSGTSTTSTTNGTSGSTSGEGAVAALANREQLPQAVRSQLALGEGSGMAGIVTRDMMLSPQP